MLTSIANTAIDAVQSGKKEFVNTFIKHEGLAQILNSFVDAQTAYTKSAVETGITTAAKLGKLAISKEFFGGK